MKLPPSSSDVRDDLDRVVRQVRPGERDQIERER